MNTTLKTIIGIVVGLIIGSFVNATIGANCPIPEGADVSSLKGLKDSLHLYQQSDFVYPFLAHAIGTLIGVFIATFIAHKKMLAAQIVSILYFFAGLFMTIYLDFEPLWFSIVDLLFAYIPMGVLGYIIAKKISK